MKHTATLLAAIIPLSVLATLVIVLLFSSTDSGVRPASAQDGLEIRINAGGSDYTDSNGDLFVADIAYVPGSFGFVGGLSHTISSSVDIAGTTDDPLYRKYRADPVFSYIFDNMSPGEYDITLYFAEPINNLMIGRRTIDVIVEGIVMLDEFDIVVGAGAARTAYNVVLTATVNDGQLNIDLNGGQDPAVVSAMAVVSKAVSVPTPTHDLAMMPADLTFLGADDGDELGHDLVLGDFNGDNINDLLAGGGWADFFSLDRPKGGEVYVIFGPFPVSGSIDLAMDNPDLIVLATGAGDHFGHELAAGDFNGDGIDDLLMGSPLSNGVGHAKSDAGEAYVIFGSPTLGGTVDLAGESPDLTIWGADAGDKLGYRVEAGDFNSDGIDDLLVSAREADAAGNTKLDAGEVYVFFGSSTLGGTIDLVEDSPDLTVLGVRGGDWLGARIQSGDFNGDGIDDLLVAAVNIPDSAGGYQSSAGAAYVIFGSPTLGGTIDLAANSPDLTILAIDARDALGCWSAAGDFNGDYIDDLLLTACKADAGGNAKPEAGEAYVIFGSPTLGGTIDLAENSPALTILGADAGDELGFGAAAGDVNGDGIDDLLLGAVLADVAGNSKTDAGQVYVIFGSSTLGGTIDLAADSVAFTVLGADAGDFLGFFLTGGDIDSDGIDDLLLTSIKAGAADNIKPQAGEVYVFFGPLVVELFINVGDGDYTDSNGNRFVADKAYVPGDFGYVGGQAHTINGAIGGTTDDLLYQKVRVGKVFSYQFDDIGDGNYDITLYFAEPRLDLAVGRRTVDVIVEGVTVLDEFDIVAAAGGSRIAHTETLSVTVLDGQLNIDFDGGNDPAVLSAIAVLSATSAGP